MFASSLPSTRAPTVTDSVVDEKESETGGDMADFTAAKKGEKNRKSVINCGLLDMH